MQNIMAYHGKNIFGPFQKSEVISLQKCGLTVLTTAKTKLQTQSV